MYSLCIYNILFRAIAYKFIQDKPASNFDKLYDVLSDLIKIDISCWIILIFLNVLFSVKYY